MGVRFVKEDPPMRLVVSSIRGPVEVLALRPCAPPAAAAEEEVAAEEPEALEAALALDSDSMRAERTAGERDCHVARISGGISAMVALCVCADGEDGWGLLPRGRIRYY